jgi:hypothetical protein
VIAFSGWYPSAAGESRGEDYVRIEVQGKLDKWAFNPAYYALMAQSKYDQQPFLLNLPDDVTQKAAKQLVGQVVIVTGDGVRGAVVGNGKRKESTTEATWVWVKTLKKADKAAAPGSVPGDATEGQPYRLTMARISEHRGQNLEIKLVPVAGKGAEIVLRFPAHSLTPHERKLVAAVRAAVPIRGNEWTAARDQVIFSLPAGKPNMSEKWWIGVRIVPEPDGN